MHPSCGSFLLCSDWVAFLQVHFFRFSNFCVSYSTHQPSNMLWSGFLLGLQDWYLFPWWSGWQAPEPWLMWLMNLKVLICCCLPRSTKSVVVVDGLRGEQQRIARSRRLYKQHASCRTKSDITWNIMRSHGTPRMHLSCGSFLPCHDWIFFKYRFGFSSSLSFMCRHISFHQGRTGRKAGARVHHFTETCGSSNIANLPVLRTRTNQRQPPCWSTDNDEMVHKSASMTSALPVRREG